MAVTEHLVRDVSRGRHGLAGHVPERASAAGLTHRETVVLEHLTHGATLDEVARRLFVSRNTVKSQVRSVYRKLGVTCRADAIAWARSDGGGRDHEG